MSGVTMPRPKRKAYVVAIELFPHEWDQFRSWAHLRGVTGRELIAAILENWLVKNPVPDRELDGDEGTTDAAE